jgi:tRNA (guanine37-N1)-methyltransferase
VPDVLLSGHHAAIARWRRDERLRRTASRRPDMLAAIDEQDLDTRDREVLEEPSTPAPARGSVDQ